MAGRPDPICRYESDIFPRVGLKVFHASGCFDRCLRITVALQWLRSTCQSKMVSISRRSEGECRKKVDGDGWRRVGWPPTPILKFRQKPSASAPCR
jgi:hypothetical protein